MVIISEEVGVWEKVLIQRQLPVVNNYKYPELLK
jgi:hypothetical protein